MQLIASLPLWLRSDTNLAITHLVLAIPITYISMLLVHWMPSLTSTFISL